MKVFIDDKRNPPDDSWVVCRDMRSAYDLLLSEVDNITHVAFDFYLDDTGFRTCGDLISRLIGRSQYDGKDYLGLPMENYSFHSSDSAMNDQMRCMILQHQGKVDPKLPDPPPGYRWKKPKTKATGHLRSLMKSGRR